MGESFDDVQVRKELLYVLFGMMHSGNTVGEISKLADDFQQKMAETYRQAEDRQREGK